MPTTTTTTSHYYDYDDDGDDSAVLLPPLLLLLLLPLIYDNGDSFPTLRLKPRIRSRETGEEI